MNQSLDRELSRLSQRAGSSQSSLLTEMVQYHLGLRKAGDRPGKRLRANIALLTCEAFGRRYADALWAALPHSNGRTDFHANKLSTVLYGGQVRCVSFLSTSVRSSPTTPRTPSVPKYWRAN